MRKLISFFITLILLMPLVYSSIEDSIPKDYDEESYDYQKFLNNDSIYINKENIPVYKINFDKVGSGEILIILLNETEFNELNYYDIKSHVVLKYLKIVKTDNIKNITVEFKIQNEYTWTDITIDYGSYLPDEISSDNNYTYYLADIMGSESFIIRNAKELLKEPIEDIEEEINPTAFIIILILLILIVCYLIYNILKTKGNYKKS